nr:rod shape-determining protein MreD [Shuttleworthia satelles]
MNETLYQARRFLVTGLMIFICLLLQMGALPKLKLGIVMPNLMVILTSTAGFMRSQKQGMLMGFFCGIALDLFSSQVFGYYALIYLLIGSLNGLFRHLFFGDDLKMPLAMIAASDLLYGLMIYISAFFLHGNREFLFYLLNIMIPEAVYTGVISLILYPLIYRIYRWMQEDKQRRRSLG